MEAALVVGALIGLMGSGCVAYYKYHKNCSRHGRTTPIHAPSSPQRLFVQPMLLVLAIQLAAADILSTAWVPVLFENAKLINELIPLHPKDLLEAFQLGALVGRLRGYTSEELNPSVIDEILAAAAQIVGREVSGLTVEMLLGVEKEIELLVDERGIVQRILAMFSLVNLLWLVALVGLMCTTLPFLRFVLRPVMNLLYRALNELFQLLVALHHTIKPIYEPMLYMASFLCFVYSMRCPQDVYSMAGTQAAIITILLGIAAWMYTAFLTSSHDNRDKRLFAMLTCSYIVAMTIPLAIMQQSILLGFLVVACIMSTLGFSIACHGLCYVIGFDGPESLARATFAALLMNLLFASLRILGIADSQRIAPFAPAVHVLGGSIYLLGCLIMSSPWYNPCPGTFRSRGAFYKRLNGLMIFSLTVFICLGEIYGLSSMANVGKVYVVLYGLEKYSELASRMPVVWAFTGFGILFGIATFLSQNPEYVSSLFYVSE